jgi:hypothetical protein
MINDIMKAACAQIALLPVIAGAQTAFGLELF